MAETVVKVEGDWVLKNERALVEALGQKGMSL